MSTSAKPSEKWDMEIMEFVSLSLPTKIFLFTKELGKMTSTMAKALSLWFQKMEKTKSIDGWKANGKMENWMEKES